MIRCANDDGFGPVLTSGPNCYSFDFTLVFEDYILSIAPCGIALLLAIPRLYFLFRRQAVVRWPLLRAVKLSTYITLAALQLAIVILLAQNKGFHAHTTIAATALNLVTAVVLGAVSDLEHVRSLTPSFLNQTFFFFAVLCDLPRVRTQWFLPENYTVAALFTTAFSIKVLLIVVESVQKFHHSVLAGKDVSPEDYQGIFGRTFFTWLNPLFLKGYRNNLTLDDLWTVDEDLKGQRLYERLLANWKRVNHQRKHCLTTATLKTFFPELAMAFFPRLGLLGLNLAQPYLVNSAIRFIDNKNAPKSDGYGLIGGYAVCYLGIALTTRWYMQVAFRTMAKVRGSLVTIIYKTMLTIRAETGNSSAALSLMSTDVDRITFTTFNIVDIAPSVIQIGIALGILGTQLGGSCVAPIVLCIICGFAAARIAKIIPPRQRRWMAAIQKRVGITADIVGSMKGVKVAGLNEKAEEQIQALRDYELERSKSFRIAPSMLMPAVTFAVYAIVQKVSGNGQFGVAKAFTALSVLNILIGPVMTITTAWTNLASALACLDRIQAFLLKEKRDDFRTLLPRSDAGSFTTRDSVLPTDAASEKSMSLEKPWIKVRNGTFGWHKDSPILKDVELDIMPGELTLVIGPVASGKSTLLKALIGEARMFEGSVEFTVPEDVAYCDQDAWLLNRSIKDNVLAYEEFHEEFYDKVINACQLVEDINQFPKRDDTIIGSQGVSLSGGQKQRVALARAVYNRKAIVILDDILKGLDADTYSKCFTAIFGPEGLLRKNRTAIILATHNIQLLPFADHIVVLNEDGRIVQRGSFDHLNSSDGFVKELGLKKTSMDEAAAKDAELVELELKEKELVIERIASAKAMGRGPPMARGPPTGMGPPAGGPSRGKRNADAMYSYLRSLGGVYFAFYAFFTVCNMGFRTAQPLWLDVWTDANADDPDGRVGYYVGIYVLFGVLNVFFMGLEMWLFMVIIVPHSAKVLHRKILIAAMHAPMAFFVATDAGEIVNRFSQDMTLVDMQLPMSFMMCYAQAVGAVSQIILTCVASGYLAITIPVLLVVLYCVQKFYLRTSRQMRLLDLEAKSPLYSDFIASFAGLTALRAYGWTRDAENENLRRLNVSQKPYYLLYCIQRWLSLVLNLIVAGMAVVVIGLAVGLRDRISPGLLGVALTSVMGIGMTLSMLIQMWTQLETSLGAVTRVNQFVADTPRDPDGPDKPPPNWPSRGAVSVQHLEAKYGDRTVLENINLEIHPGEKIAICGRSGSGKSTFISLLLRLYQPAAGRIEIDGIETGQLNLNALRESLVALPQDPMFLAGTVRYNLDPLEKATEAELLDVLDRTQLRSVIDEKGGLDADLNTDWLSAGQRQLFCLARAMTRKSRVLLLDEATSSLDRETEAFVDKLIRTDFAEWTAIVVAHRLRTVADFDKVLVLQEGRVIEYDSPKELLERDSMFKTLWDLQETS
ncbi:ABC transporter [Niveomyces insectorum RCEF 264]|uniref:ABC transporter n=1 Tax=Niveomyces insectorum RCEF 264 TaxID=1081102 RepID=A0A167Y1E1_9HYPO|nr:ABC transporter [Niveomyces insectorum RCEF 264]